MRVDRIDLYVIELRLNHAFRASTHGAGTLRHVVVRASAEGLVGWGEAPTPVDPYYTGETTDTVWSVMHDFLAPAVLGRVWDTIEEFVALYSRVKANNFARSGIEMAAWNLLAAATGRPLPDLLGGAARSTVESGVSLGMDRDLGRLCDTVQRHVDQGYRRVKLKIGVGADVSVLEAVRERFPTLPLMVDANCAYTLQDVPHLQVLDAFDLMMIEQPLAWDDLTDHAVLQQNLRTPLCLDESLNSAKRTRRALKLGSCRVVNIKPVRLGGLLEAKLAHDACLAAGTPVWCGGMHDFGVSRAANIALSSLPGFTLPGDNSGSDKYFDRDIVTPETRAKDGLIDVPDQPVPYEVDMGFLAAHTRRHARLTADG
ncbi:MULTISPECIES: o-succinylbenzoate synthase [unclassified Streptomyces]|uniref:o-succinylbenzoate synthase n=1 Tax=unclassified Streptomyces TaxID=2593676 RepID=UPI0033CEBADE